MTMLDYIERRGPNVVEAKEGPSILDEVVDYRDLDETVERYSDIDNDLDPELMAETAELTEAVLRFVFDEITIDELEAMHLRGKLKRICGFVVESGGEQQSCLDQLKNPYDELFIDSGYAVHMNLAKDKIFEKLLPRVIEKFVQLEPLLGGLLEQDEPSDDVDQRLLSILKAQARSHITTVYGLDPMKQGRGHPAAREYYRRIGQIEADPPLRKAKLEDRHARTRKLALEALHEKYWPRQSSGSYTMDFEGEETQYSNGLRYLNAQGEVEPMNIYTAMHDYRVHMMTRALDTDVSPDEILLMELMGKLLAYGRKLPNAIDEMAWSDLYEEGLIGIVGLKMLLLDPEERNRFKDFLCGVDSSNDRPARYGSNMFDYKAIDSTSLFVGERAGATIDEDARHNEVQFGFHGQPELNGRLFVPEDIAHINGSEGSGDTSNATMARVHIKPEFMAALGARQSSIPGYTLTHPGRFEYTKNTYDPYDTSRVLVDEATVSKLVVLLNEIGLGKVAAGIREACDDTGACSVRHINYSLAANTQYALGYAWNGVPQQLRLDKLREYKFLTDDGRLKGNCTVSASVMAGLLEYMGFESPGALAGFLMQNYGMDTQAHVQTFFTDPRNGNTYVVDATGGDSNEFARRNIAAPVSAAEKFDATVEALTERAMNAQPLTREEKVRAGLSTIQKELQICAKLMSDAKDDPLENLATLDAENIARRMYSDASKWLAHGSPDADISVGLSEYRGMLTNVLDALEDPNRAQEIAAALQKLTGGSARATKMLITAIDNYLAYCSWTD